jgi:hypothetical protein
MSRSKLRHRTSQTTNAPVDIVVLTKGRDLLSNVLSTARTSYRVHHALSVSRAEEIVQAESVGVLVTNALPESLPRILPRLRQWNPNLVIVAVGKRDTADAMMQLAEQGEVFRFLLQPLSSGQLGIYLDAAVRGYLDRLQNTVEEARTLRVDARESRPTRSALPFSLAATIFLGSLGGFFLLQQQDAGGVADPVAKTLELDADGRALTRALVAAERAREERRFVEPEGDNAYYYYKQILAISPHHAEAARGINDLVNLMFMEAEVALRDLEYDRAREALTRARRIAPSHPRLGVIGSQIDTAEQTTLLNTAVGAARQGDFERSQRLIAAAASGRRGETSQVREVRDQISEIREANERQREQLTEAFSASLAEDRLIGPGDENARDQLHRLELLGAPEETTVPMHEELVGALERRVEDALIAKSVDEASAHLEALSALSRNTWTTIRAEEFASTLSQLRASDLEVERLIDLAGARMAENRLLRPVGDNAGTYVEALLSMGTLPPGGDAVVTRYGQQLVASALRAMHDKNLRDARRFLDAAATLERYDIGLADAEHAFTLAAERGAGEFSLARQ